MSATQFSRLKILQVFSILIFLVLIARLWHLQIIKGAFYKDLANKNRIRKMVLSPPRGIIYDRNRNPLAKNRLSFSVCIVPADLPKGKEERIISRLSEILSIEPKKIREKLKDKNSICYEPVKIAEDVNVKSVTTIEEEALRLPGVIVQETPKRFYPHSKMAAHVLGYLGEISKREIEQLREKDYQPGDEIGKEGVEKYYDLVLRGKRGGQQVEVDAQGRLIRVLGKEEAQPGNNIVLTIDKEIQKTAEGTLARRRGAVVVMNPKTFDILAMVSSPGFDPNIFPGKISKKEWARLSKNPLYPLENRAIRCSYQPGSLFKIITALAALKEGKVTSQSRFYCRGGYNIGKWTFRCWHRAGHGNIDFTKGIAQSCNVMFYTLGRAVEAEKLAETGRILGLSHQTGVDLPRESRGLIGDPKWRKERKKPWYPGDTLNLAIGQGDVLVTPLQMACVFSTIANGGSLKVPKIVKEIRDSTGKRVKNFTPKRANHLPLKRTDLEILRRGLRKVVTQGTGRAANSLLVPIAGKTGTAQNPHGRPHAWFAGFAPVDNPQIVVVVLVEHGGTGGQVAAPIARRIFEAIFANREVVKRKSQPRLG